MAIPFAASVDPTDVVGRRIAAWLIDVVIDGLVTFGVMSLLGFWDAYIGIVTAGTPGSRVGVTSQQVTAVLIYVGFLVLWAVFKMLLVSTYGWTPGKLALGLRIVSWDGRPPGLGKAFVRSLVVSLGDRMCGCLYWIPGLLVAISSRGHRQPADMAANTYVIDASHFGHLIIAAGDKVIAGPPSVTRAEANEYFREHGVDVPVPPPGRKMTEPFFDKKLDAYVVFSSKRKEWLELDSKSGEWIPLGGGGLEPPEAD